MVWEGPLIQGDRVRRGRGARELRRGGVVAVPTESSGVSGVPSGYPGWCGGSCGGSTGGSCGSWLGGASDLGREGGKVWGVASVPCTGGGRGGGAGGEVWIGVHGGCGEAVWWDGSGLLAWSVGGLYPWGDQCSIQDWQRGGHFWPPLYRFGGHLVKLGDRIFFTK